MNKCSLALALSQVLLSTGSFLSVWSRWWWTRKQEAQQDAMVVIDVYDSKITSLPLGPQAHVYHCVFWALRGTYHVCTYYGVF